MSAINFYPACGLNSYEGYGRTEIGFIKGAKEAGLELHFYPSPKRVTLQFGNPKWGASPFMQEQRKWLFSMLESERASEGWVKNINTHYERLICPAPDMPQLFRESGVSIPIDYIPLGVDAFPMPYKRRKIGKPFTFLAYSYGEIRKGADLAVMAFRYLYNGNPDYRLIIKARDNADVQWLKTIQNEQISVIGGAITEHEWQKLANSVHVFLFPSRAEGFGLPPREMTLSGLPTVATRWLGMWDAGKWAFPLSVTDMRPSQYMLEVNNKEGALWSEPSFDDLLHWMEWIPQNYEQATQDNLKHRDYLLSCFTWKQAVERFMELLQEEL
jgi:glycosyltransferase involved in cell wall biosynthesis